MRSLKPLTRCLSAWHGFTSVPKDTFSDQRKLLLGTKVKTIFDVGANIGEVSAEYGSLFPEATIYSFEPFAESFEQLRSRFKARSSIKPIQAAVSSKTGVKKFYINRDSSTNSLLPSLEEARIYVDLPDATQNIEVIEVPVTTIDGFCKQKSIDEIQILKMDIQGGELMALEGARAKLAQAAISLIYIEMLFVPIYEGQAYYHNICEFLYEYGYSLFDMYNFAYAKNRQIKWCDAIFVSPKL